MRCWLACRKNHSGRTRPFSRFSLTTYDYDRLTCYYEISRLFVGYRRSIASSQRFTHVNPPILPFVLAPKSQLAAKGAKLENRRRGPVRKTTIRQRFRSRLGWIFVPLGTAGYIPGKYILRVRGHHTSEICLLRPSTAGGTFSRGPIQPSKSYVLFDRGDAYTINPPAEQ